MPAHFLDDNNTTMGIGNYNTNWIIHILRSTNPIQQPPTHTV